MKELITHKITFHFSFRHCLVRSVNLPNYALSCGTTHGTNPIFEKGHGASAYWHGVTCPDCLKYKPPEDENAVQQQGFDPEAFAFIKALRRNR